MVLLREKNATIATSLHLVTETVSGSPFEAICKPYYFAAWERRRGGSEDSSEDLKENAPAALLLSSDSDDEETSNVQESSSSRRRKQPQHHVCEEGRHVRFSAAKIREHSVTLGDHPACCDLMPLSLDWKYGEEQIYDINDYELMRESSGRTERGRVARLDLVERKRILENCCMMGAPAVVVDDHNSSLEFDLQPDPVMVQDVDQFDRYTTTESPLDRPATCDAFAAFARWPLMFGDDICGFDNDDDYYPTMTVQVLEE